MSDGIHPTLREQIEAFQAQLATRLSPEVQERSKARRAQLVASGIADKKPQGWRNCTRLHIA